MGSRVFKIYDNNKIFDSAAFKNYFEVMKKKTHISGEKMEQQLAEQLNISKDAIHKWVYEKNGPGNLELIKNLANALDIKDYRELLMDIDEEKQMISITNRQMDAVKRIYDVCIWFLDEFEATDGFNDYWYKYKTAGVEDPEEAIWNLVEGYIRKIYLVLRQEYFDLHDCEIYEALKDFVNEDLYETFNGKLSYGFRFEALVEGKSTTGDDYNKAMVKLNKIIQRIVVKNE